MALKETGVKYPSQYETEVVLRDGSRIRLRPIRRDDAGNWLDFIHRVGPYSKYLRFHYMPPEMGLEDAARFCTVDYVDSFAFVAEVLKGERWEMVAVGRYHRLPNGYSAEVAFVIEDAHQGKGIGTKLVEWLVNVATRNDITVFEGDVLPENVRMLQLFRDYGFPVATEARDGVYHIRFPLTRTKRVVEKEERREHTAALASLKPLLYPRSIAVIGASRTPGSIGQLVLKSILQGGFTGVVYPVNPTAESILSVKAYPSVLDVPGEVDLGVIVVKAENVARVTHECGQKGIHALVVISDGFRERGPEGAARERELRDLALGYGMRLVGPNCMGIINTDPAASLNATFSLIFPPPGNLSFISQSGAMGIVILQYATGLNVGISTFLSVGNCADISPTDLMHYWEEDAATKVILLYMESFGDGRKFSRLAREVSAIKPMVALKSGNTPAGSRAALSHTGALATPDIVSDALFRQAGIIRVNSVEELFDTAILLANQPVPKGKNLVIVTNGGGPGIAAADACAHHGLALPEFSEETKRTLRSVVTRDIGLNNPLDLTGSSTPEEFEATLKILAADKDIHAVLTIFIPAAVVEPKIMETTMQRIIPYFQRHGKTLLTCFMGHKGLQGRLGVEGKFVPGYLFPEAAVSALAKATVYGELKQKPRGKIPKFAGLRRERANTIVQKALLEAGQQPCWLSSTEIFELLDCYGIRAVETHVARSASEAVALANRIGFPVAVKVQSSTIIHKTEVGGVALDLKTDWEVENAFKDIQNRLKQLGREQEMDGVILQHMVRGGVEAIVGVTQDPSFGPLIMFGAGGIYAEMLNDVALSLHPLTDVDARDLVHSIKMVRLFEGYRQSPPGDTPALEELLLRVSALVEDVPQINEMDLNPVKVMPQGQGYWVVDARIMLR